MSKINKKDSHFIFSASDFERLKLEVLNAMRKDLPPNLTYHSVKHTENVILAAITIATHENVGEPELTKIKIAALFHDSGFMFDCDQHEEESCKYARKVLQNYTISTEDINHICKMIMATKIPQRPKDQCSEILADADLEYLGTEQFLVISSFLFEELKLRNPAFDLDDWNIVQINFLTQHQYFTNYCKKYKSPIKNLHLKALIDSIE